MRSALKTTAIGMALLCVVSAPLAAQTGDDKLKTLLQDLDALIEKGEAQKLADPWFLQDLRGLSARYGEVWPVVLMDHRFDSKGTLPKAPWEVRQGQMKMDWSRGLRSRVEVASAGQTGAAKSDEEVMGEIVGSLLGQARHQELAKRPKAGRPHHAGPRPGGNFRYQRLPDASRDHRP